MKRAAPKFQSQTDLWYEDPVYVPGESLTDPSQDIDVRKLVETYVRTGGSPEMVFGEDQRFVDRLDAYDRVKELKAQLDEAVAAEKKSAADKAAADRAAAVKAREQRTAQLLERAVGLKPGSPELLALAAELTAPLPGLEGPPSV